MPTLLGAIEQGTSSTRFIVFDESTRIVAESQVEHAQIYPQPGWVEHDPVEIWRNTQTVIAGALRTGGLQPRDLAATGRPSPPDRERRHPGDARRHAVGVSEGRQASRQRHRPGHVQALRSCRCGACDSRRADIRRRSCRHREGRCRRSPMECNEGPRRRFPNSVAFNAALRNLDEWVRKGTVPPRADPIVVENGKPVLDEYGNVKGGVRCASFCFIAGHEIPFTRERLRTLYPTHAAYVDAVRKNVADLVRKRFIVREGGEELVSEAQKSAVP